MELSSTTHDYQAIDTIFVIIALWYHVGQSNCFVTRLPCGYNGNFSVRYDEKYYKGKVGKTVNDVTRKECSLHCLVYDGCLFFNHKKDGSICELMTSHKGAMTSRVAWQVVSTDYRDVQHRGAVVFFPFFRSFCCLSAD